LQGQHPYDVSKSTADLIAHTYAVSFDLPVVVTRCGNFFGGGDLNWNRIVPGTIRSVLHGKRPIIRSDGNFIRDFFYVEDGAAAYMLLAEQLGVHPELRGQAFNFSYGNQFTVLELARRILAHMESDLQPEVLNAASNEIRKQYLNSSKARRILGWLPLFTLEEGLDKTIAWYKEFLSKSI
jgi:CDP-glucose 4,6-dehydratase